LDDDSLQFLSIYCTYVYLIPTAFMIRVALSSNTSAHMYQLARCHVLEDGYVCLKVGTTVTNLYNPRKVFTLLPNVEVLFLCVVCARLHLSEYYFRYSSNFLMI
jgi:hypothetical protein